MFRTGTTENWDGPAASGGEAPSSSSGGGSPASPSTPAPAASAPASTGTSTPAAPTSAVQALERAEAALSAAPSAAAPGDTSGASVPAPTAPAKQGVVPPATQPSPAPASGPVPFDRHEAAVRNAREAGRDEAMKQFSWLRETNLSQQQIQRAIDIARQIDTDANDFYRRLGSELGVDGGQEQLEELIDPEADLIDSTGTRKTYSEKALAQIRANDAERLRRQMMEQFGPALQYYQSSQDRDDMAAIRQEGVQNATNIVEYMSTLPHWDVGKVGAIYKQLDPRIRQQWGPAAALQVAYNKYMTEQVLPTLGQQAQARTIADMQRSAAAGSIGAVVPAPTPTPTRKIREGNIDDIAQLMRDKEAAMNATG